MAYTKVTTTLVDTLNRNTTGSAATLTTARTIGGTSFDGSGNIAVATATEATNITAAANNSADETVYPTFVDGATGTQGLETDTGFTYNPSSGNLTTTGQLGGATLNLSGNATVGGNLTVTGTSTVVDTVTMNAQNAIVFEGATADNYETTLSIVDPTADHTQYLINQGGYIPVLAAATTVAISATPAELNILDGVTSTAAELNLLNGVSGLVQADLTKLAAVDATAAEINLLDAITRGSIIVGNSSGASARLAVGSNDYVLTSDGTDIAWEAASSFDADAAQTFNDSGADVDFRIESNDSDNMLFVDGGNNKVLVSATNTASVTNAATALAARAFEVNGNSGEGSDNLSIFAMADGTGNYGMEVSNSAHTAQYDLLINPVNGGSVGIGTTTASSSYTTQLHVHGSGTGASVHITDNGTGAGNSAGLELITHSDLAYIWNREPAALLFGTNATERMRIDSSGDVLIGQNSQTGYTFAEKLVVGDGDANDGITIQSGSTHQGNLAFNHSDGTTAHGRISYQHNSNYMSFITNAIEKMRIQSDGIVYICPSTLITPTIVHSGGIGDLSKLRLINRSGQSTNKGGLIEFGGVTDDGYTRSDIFGAIAGLKTNATSANREGYLAFYTNDGDSIDERMRILTDGSLVIGKTAVNQTTTTGLDLRPTGTVLRGDFSVTNNEFVIWGNYGSPAGTASMQFRYDNSAKGSIGLTSSAVSFNTSSDYRLKENVSYSWNATTRLKQLKPARFNWIEDDTNTLIDGFLAHEVSSIVPEAIHGEKDAVYPVGHELEGEIKGQEMDHSKLVPLLVKTVQELEARIATLEG